MKDYEVFVYPLFRVKVTVRAVSPSDAAVFAEKHVHKQLVEGVPLQSVSDDVDFADDFDSAVVEERDETGTLIGSRMVKASWTRSCPNAEVIPNAKRETSDVQPSDRPYHKAEVICNEESKL